MKVKALSQQALSKKQFFLLMIVPLLLGCIIFLTSRAYAETWDRKDDPCLIFSPTKQGWMMVDFQDTSSPFKPDEESVRFVSR